MTILKKTIAIIIITSSIFSLHSCTKNTASGDVEKPVITMVEPTANDTISFAIEPEIHIEFTATDNDALHSLSVTLKDSNNNILVSSTPNVLNLKAYSFHTHYEPTSINALTKFNLTIEAKDHTGNTLLKELSVYMKP